MHIKKTEMPTSWPVPRKGRGKRFVAVPSHSVSKGISILFLLRDVLGIVRTRKEARYMTLGGMVRVNNQVRKDENFPMLVFDTLTLSPKLEAGVARYTPDIDGASPKLEDRNYRLEIKNRKFALVEISANEAVSKIVKIRGKKILRSRIRGVGCRGVGVSAKERVGEQLIQMNLDDGQNVLTKEKFSVGDSAVLSTAGGSEEKGAGRVSVKKVLPLKVGAKVEIVLGKHAGEKGELVGFEELVRGRDYKIKLEDKTVSLPYKTILVIG